MLAVYDFLPRPEDVKGPPIAIRIPPVLLAKIDKLAKGHGMSRSTILRALIKSGLSSV